MTLIEYIKTSIDILMNMKSLETTEHFKNVKRRSGARLSSGSSRNKSIGWPQIPGSLMGQNLDSTKNKHNVNSTKEKNNLKLSKCDSSENFKMNDTELFMKSLVSKPIVAETPAIQKQSINKFLPSMSAGQTDSALSIGPRPLKMEELLIKYEGQMRTHIKIES